MAGTGRRSIIPPADAGPAASATVMASQQVRVVRHLQSGLVVRLTEADGRIRACVNGEIDLDCADLLERVLADALRSAPGGLDLDLSAVGFFDCAGLNALLRLRALARRDGAELAVLPVSAPVARLLDLTGTWPAFPLAAAAVDSAPTVRLRPARRARPA
nr:STAS domain-containing protein [Streptomyces sp. NBC_00899]